MLPETIKQIHCLEKSAFLFFAGFLLLLLFSKKWNFISHQKLRKAILFFAFLAAILLRIVSAERGFETMVLFDSAHYTVPAQEFLKTGDFTLPINEKNHPGSKAPGFSLLIAPIYLLFKNNLGSAVFCPFTLGIFSLLLLYSLAKHLTDPSTALFALLLLAFSPLHVTYSRLIMPSMVPLFFILAGFFLMVRYPKSLWLCVLAGVCFGFAGVTRYFAVAAIPAAVFYLRGLKNIFALLVGAAIPLAWLFYFQWQEFGSPFQTGYGYWEHFAVMIQKPFSLRYALGIPPTSGGSPNALFNLVSATGAFIPYPNILSSRPDQIIFAFLIWIFAATGLRHFFQNNRPLFFFIAVFFIGFYLPHALLNSQTGHFMLPVVPFIILAAAKGMSLVAKKIFSKTRSFSYGAVLTGLLSFLPFAYTFSHEPFEPQRKEYLDFLKEELPQNVFLISDYEPVIFTHQVGREKNTTYLGISKQVTYAQSKFFLKGEVLPPPIEIFQSIANGQPVYVSPFDEENFKADYAQLALDFKLNPVAQSKHFKLYALEPLR